MIFETIIISAVVVIAGVCAAIGLTIVGFGVTSVVLAVVLFFWAYLAGFDVGVGIFGLGLWLLFNVSFFLGGIALGADESRLTRWRSRFISMKNAKSN